jgi:type II secretory pathway component HofQ
MKTLTALLLAAAAALAGDTREDAARKLETKISIDVKDVRLGDAIQIFRDVTGLNFVVQEGSELLVRLTVREVTAKSALRLLLQPTGLGAGFEHGVVVIRNREALASATTFRIYDIRAALRKLQDFPGPRLGRGLQGPPPGVI